jgi:hypothetical protein
LTPNAIDSKIDLTPNAITMQTVWALGSWAGGEVVSADAY